MSSLVGLGQPSQKTDAALLRDKENKLFSILGDLGRVLVAYSGGTDSAYLAWAANKVLGDNALAVTANSASVPSSHVRDAEEFAKAHGIKNEYVETHEFDDPNYLRNEADRCFHCRNEMFRVLKEFGGERGIQHVIYGVNVDDLGDYRPGMKAAELHGVKAPMVDSGLTKADIRALSLEAGLPTWDRPAAACLSSRVPYGTPVSVETVKTVEEGENALKALGFRQLRVRYHGQLVRIEIATDEIERALTLEMAGKFTSIFKELGFHYVTLDLEGYRQGAMNEALARKEKGTS